MSIMVLFPIRKKGIFMASSVSDKINFDFRWEGSTQHKDLSQTIQVVDLESEKIENITISIPVPQETPLYRNLPFVFTRHLHKSQTSSPKELRISVEKIGSLVLQIGVFKSIAGENSRTNRTIPIRMPKNFEIGANYRLVITCDDTLDIDACIQRREISTRRAPPPASIKLSSKQEGLFNWVQSTIFPIMDNAKQTFIQYALRDDQSLLNPDYDKNEVRLSLVLPHIQLLPQEKLEAFAKNALQFNLSQITASLEQQRKASPSKICAMLTEALGIPFIQQLMRSDLEAVVKNPSTPEVQAYISVIIESLSSTFN